MVKLMTTKKIKKHFLPLSLSGSGKFINSIHYGDGSVGKKTYIQAGLHADEAPGYMVMHHLIEMLDLADQEGRIIGEIICVPAANPIGLSQWFHDRLVGRFDTLNGINFNRSFPDIVDETARIIEKQLTGDAEKNRVIIRDAMGLAIDDINPEDESASLKKLLFSLSFDADIVLDLHCDNQAIIHMYTGSSLWPDASDLAAWTGAQAILLANESGGDPYDEACSKIWWRLKERYPDYPISPSSLAATIEYRGEADVSSDLNRKDAQNLYSFLHQRGYLSGTIPSPSAELKAEATPLSGVEHIKSYVPGIVNFLKRPGDMVKAGDKIAQIMNPYEEDWMNRITEIACKTDGLLFSLISDRMVRPGRILAKIAGRKPIEGKGAHLLTA